MSDPFGGDIKPGKVKFFQSDRPTLPFPHPWNYQRPISILETYFFETENCKGDAKHTRYLKIPFFSPVLVTRDPELIKEITLNTGDKQGQFDRDTMPSQGIARATGEDTLLYANGELWKHQKKLSSGPFKKSSLFNPEQFEEFSDIFRTTVFKRLDAFHRRVNEEGKDFQVPLEPEIKAVMLELLTNCFFGADVDYDEIWDRYVPALEKVIDHIVKDTVLNKIGFSVLKLPSFTKRIKAIKTAYADFEHLTDCVMATRESGKGLWGKFTSDAPNDKLRSNIKVFLAGALEATTSYASWAISHLARNEEMQDLLYEEVKDIEEYTPENLKKAVYLSNVLDETLRLTPSLYFLPRKATEETVVEKKNKSKLIIPKGTHILLDVWHANRDEEFWGETKTGYPASEFQPDRWNNIRKIDDRERPSHFGFGNGPRICPGKNLGQMEVALAVGCFVKLFKFKAVNKSNEEVASVSTKPKDGVLVQLELRNP